MLSSFRTLSLCCRRTDALVRTSHTFARDAHTSSLLSELADHPAALSPAKRFGRGPGSGKGKTAGRGHKGQKARSGNGAPRGFEGGQTPITRRFPKVGFHNQGQEVLSPLNLDRLQSWIDQGRIDARQPITMKHLLDSRCLHGVKDGVKLLASGKQRFTAKVDIDVTKASREAIAAVEQAGGTIVCTYRNRLSLRQLLTPERMKRPVRDAMPTRRRDVDYYAKPEKRGYLAARVASGELKMPIDPVVRAREATETVKVSA